MPYPQCTCMDRAMDPNQPNNRTGPKMESTCGIDMHRVPARCPSRQRPQEDDVARGVQLGLQVHARSRGRKVPACVRACNGCPRFRGACTAHGWQCWPGTWAASPADRLQTSPPRGGPSPSPQHPAPCKSTMHGTMTENTSKGEEHSTAPFESGVALLGDLLHAAQGRRRHAAVPPAPKHNVSQHCQLGPAAPAQTGPGDGWTGARGGGCSPGQKTARCQGSLARAPGAERRLRPTSPPSSPPSLPPAPEPTHAHAWHVPGQADHHLIDGALEGVERQPADHVLAHHHRRAKLA